MKAFVFEPTNEFIGKFDVERIDAIPRALQKFLRDRQSPPPYSYVEVSGQAWTITSLEPFRLEAGIVKSGTTERAAGRRDCTVEFDCVDCESRIRLGLKSGREVYHCPVCRMEYKTIQTDGELPVLLVVPDTGAKALVPGVARIGNVGIPPEVLRALAVFGLNEGANVEEIKRAYQEHSKQYHPDGVAHLGAELRTLAETKTEEFNGAYRVLEGYYSV